MLEFLRAAASYLRPYWRQALLMVLSQAPATAFITLQPLLLRALLDDAIVPGNVSVAALLIAAMMGLLLLHGLGNLANHLVAHGRPRQGDRDRPTVRAQHWIRGRILAAREETATTSRTSGSFSGGLRPRWSRIRRHQCDLKTVLAAAYR
jgi:hypothetical protein